MKQGWIILFLLIGFDNSAQTTFSDVTEQMNIPDYDGAFEFGSGVSAADYDSDGDIDLYLTSIGSTPNLLLRNNGLGQFEIIDSEVSINLNSSAVIWADFNGDGLLDLFVRGDCYGNPFDTCTEEEINKLFFQELDGSFSDVSSNSGLLSDREAGGALGGIAAGDINNDGYLDLITTEWYGEVKLFLNDGNGIFSDITRSSGLEITSTSWQPIIYCVTTHFKHLKTNQTVIVLIRNASADLSNIPSLYLLYGKYLIQLSATISTCWISIAIQNIT